MQMPKIRFPVICPQCGVESLMNLPVAEAASGLMRGSLKLKGQCLHAAWNATETEREQIREYLASPIVQQLANVMTRSHEAPERRVRR